MGRLPAAAVGGISIHVPREGHDGVVRGDHAKSRISIHVPREGHDFSSNKGEDFRRVLISIHVPREGHDCCVGNKCFLPNISIHVPREGHDSKHAQFFRADLRKSYKYPAERDALPTKNVCKHIKTLG